MEQLNVVLKPHKIVSSACKFRKAQIERIKDRIDHEYGEDYNGGEQHGIREKPCFFM